MNDDIIMEQQCSSINCCNHHQSLYNRYHHSIQNVFRTIATSSSPFKHQDEQ